ncbi:tRNA uridine-5-carboxymethylaminomethyl(34) synthesis GTPase MnmE [Filifactor villosus]|uniref:tRNA modification GTPase MnmE n=1 Tax=Filifactor villosus TaxID=29374 RepID=A0ABV9QS96_9FIRM
MYYIDDTIAAIATAPGEGGIGIIRISGKRALEVGEEVFSSFRGKKLVDYPGRLLYGHIVKQEEKLDEVLAVYLKAPHTYTTEDVVELHCHGGMMATRLVLEWVVYNGARMAEPGEFTKRAFLNGRIDLSQAEAIQDIISAKTSRSYAVAQSQLKGSLSEKIKKIRDKVTEDVAKITVAVDFPEEDTPEVTYEELRESMNSVWTQMTNLLSTFETGRMLKEGLKTAIVGKPNVGKSSLLNEMLEEQRAIVTDIEGTTRDVIEEMIMIEGIPLRIIDTAGIRTTEDVVEQIGVERSKQMMEEADLVLLLLDTSRELTQEDRDILSMSRGKKRILLLNKTDLPPLWTRGELDTRERILETSILKKEGIDALKKMIKDLVFRGEVVIDREGMLTNVRHKDALTKAIRSSEDALRSIGEELPLDILETDFKNCWDALGEITGESVSEDLLDTIFKNFCIGK